MNNVPPSHLSNKLDFDYHKGRSFLTDRANIKLLLPGIIFGFLLFLLRFTGLPVHIALSVVGVAVLVVYAVLTKKEWKIPALEIVMRAAYGLALISGIVIQINYVSAIALLHKIFAVLFVALLVVTVASKYIPKNKENQ